MFWYKEWIITLIILLSVYILGKSWHLIGPWLTQAVLNCKNESLFIGIVLYYPYCFQYFWVTSRFHPDSITDLYPSRTSPSLTQAFLNALSKDQVTSRLHNSFAPAWNRLTQAVLHAITSPGGWQACVAAPALEAVGAVGSTGIAAGLVRPVWWVLGGKIILRKKKKLDKKNQWNDYSEI